MTKEEKIEAKEKVKEFNKKISEANAQEFARSIKKVSGIDLFKKTRVRENVYMRSIFNTALYKTYNWGLTTIANFYKKNGNKDYDHATVFHSLKMFEIYTQYEPHLLNIYETVSQTQSNKGGLTYSIYLKLQTLRMEDLEKISWLVNRYFKTEKE